MYFAGKLVYLIFLPSNQLAIKFISKCVLYTYTTIELTCNLFNLNLLLPENDLLVHVLHTITMTTVENVVKRLLLYMY